MSAAGPSVAGPSGAGSSVAGPSIADAVALATWAHNGQLDKAGEAYIGHPLRVMETVGRTAAGAGVDVAHARMAAILHDVVEDSDLTVTGLATAGYPSEVVAAVDALSHRDGEPVECYLARVAADRIAVVVKRADMADNSDPVRLARLPAERARELTIRYAGRRRLLDDLVVRNNAVVRSNAAARRLPGNGPAAGGPQDHGAGHEGT
ncbi:metal-dependent phosphohydrolase [Frankia sp. R43]|nr:metal-dependent phosphohydrolase [Frankia sp. R43]